MTGTTPDRELAYITHLEGQVSRLQWTVVLLSLPLTILASIIGIAWFRGLPIHFIPPGGPGISRPGVVPDSVALRFAREVLTHRYTFTPLTFAEVQADFQTILHPSMVPDFEARLAKETAQVKEYHLGMQTSVAKNAARIAGRTGERITVALQGRRMVWVGSSMVREEVLTASLTLTPWHMESDQPGLVLVGMSVVPPFSVSGP